MHGIESSSVSRQTQTAFQVTDARSAAGAVAAWCLLAGVGLIVLAGCGAEDPGDLLSRAQQALRTGDHATAVELAERVSESAREWPAAQLIAGKAESARRNTKAGLTRFCRIPRDGSPESLEAAWLAGELHLTTCALSPAVDSFEYVVGHQAEALKVRERLAMVYSSAGLHHRAATHQLELLRHGYIGIRELVALTEPDRPYDAHPVFRRCLENGTDDPLLTYAAAIRLIEDRRTDQALRLLRRLVKRKPEFAEAQALLGELLTDGSASDFDDWSRDLPSAVRTHPDVLFVLGQWAQRLGERDVAIRCYWETARQVPHHHRAVYQLGQLLEATESDARQAFSAYAESLREYSLLMERALIGHGTDDDSLRRIIELLMEMGRDWEAYAWAALSSRIGGSRPWLNPVRQSLAYLPGSLTPRFIPDRTPAHQFDYSHLPGFDSIQVSSGKNSLRPEGGASLRTLEMDGRLAFSDDAAALGIDFVYDQSPDVESHGVRVFESTGGGAGVLDFEPDGWPDLFLTQGEPWPPGSHVPVPSRDYSDALYRNLQTRFEDIAAAAGLTDDSYGQGCSAADFNNDGFTDLYVANIGRNRLLLNNGDGTFTDVTGTGGIDVSAWTTSCLITDLNADGLPDLYDVNYLRGEGIFAVECGETRCSVRHFAGARDGVWLSQGDLTFLSVPDPAPEKNAKGLGIVTVYLPGDPRPSLFIANDQVPNFFLRPTDAAGRYRDDALVCGLSVNRDGQPTACMGVAAADLNHDGRVDLFVTNFEGEANNLYVQRDGGLFEDAVSGSGLLSPGVPYVGWGTQFLDADNDGEPDLIVANGHVADFGEMDVEYRMPLQFFHNRGHGRFQTQQPASRPGLFDHRSLGRAVARLDWNRDGRVDFVVTRIGEPCILATNRSSAGGHWIDVRLSSTSTARDAAGAVVTVAADGARFRQRLIRGDGYQASNESVLHFGLGNLEHVSRIQVEWPSGTVSDFEVAEVDVELVLVEGAAEPTVLRGGRTAVIPEPRNGH